MTEPLKEGDLLAAVDLGSNSFHMVVARYVLGQLRVVDRLREMVRLAAGLDAHGGLSADARQRALDCLARFGERLRSIPRHRVRAIATNTVRRLRAPQAFLLPAETALGHGIQVVAGREEARLIYLGVAQGLPPKQKRRLVMDIGGGSTEFIIGQGFEPIERESLQMGCVATTRRFFANGKLGKRRWKEALTEVSAELQQFSAAYRAHGWQETIGSSGTIKAIGNILAGMKLTRGAITDVGLRKLRDALLEFEEIDAIKLPGLSDERKPVIAGGILVLEAAFNELALSRMQVAETAMREGVLYDMVGRAQDRDPRDASIEALSTRYGVDVQQAQRVKATALALFDQAAQGWHLDDEARLLLRWAARLHEIGLSIAHSQYHHHSAYVAEHSDIAGFATQEQQAIAAMLRCQRRSLSLACFEKLPERMQQSTLRLTLLLRLAVLLHRSHDPQPPPPPQLQPLASGYVLSISGDWLDAHALTREDLDAEMDYLRDVGLELRLET